MSVRWDVLGFGVVTVDDLIYVQHYPPSDGKIEIQAEERAGGGLTGTALVAAARLGARAAYCGVLGSDELSRFTLQEFEREGVDCSAVLYRDEARPVHAIVIVDQTTGHRTVFYSMANAIKRQPHELTSELITCCRVLFLDHRTGEGGLHAMRLAHQHGIPVVGDVEDETIPQPWT